MKKNLKDSCIVAIMALVCGGLTFGLLDRHLFGQESPDPGVGIWLSQCVSLGPCPAGPGANCSNTASAGDTCWMCQFQVPRFQCQYIFANVQCTGLPGTGVCGTQTRGICAGPGLACNSVGLWGLCDAPSCASGPILDP